MSYFCDIYDNVRQLLSTCLLISWFLILFSYMVESKFLYRKLILTGFTGVIILSVALVLLPSKEFACGT